MSGGVPLPEAPIQSLRCRLLVRPYVGVDDIDTAAATAVGLLVANVPDTCSDEVATHTVALLLALHRHVVGLDDDVRSGRWRARLAGSELAMRRGSALRVGVLGLGRIGGRVATRLEALGFRVLGCDPYVDDRALDVTRVSLGVLLAESDYLVVTAALTDETRGLLDHGALSRLPVGAAVVNTARGAIVDEAALVHLLESGHLSGAALDVLQVEPPDPGDRLLQLPGVLLTPHAAVYSTDALADTGRRVRDIVSRPSSASYRSAP